jgi:hypothetical protein
MALSFTKAQMADLVFNMVVPDGSEDNINVGDIELMIEPAAMELCSRIIKTGEIERLRDPAIPVNVVSGVGILPASVYPETIMTDRGGIITFVRSDDTTPTRQPLKYTDKYDFLRRPKQGGETDIYFTIRGSGGAAELHVFSAAATACSGTATVSACREYDYANLPAQLAGEFIAVLTEMGRKRMNMSNPRNTTIEEDPVIASKQ